MLADKLLSILLGYWPFILVSAILIHVLHNKFNNGLNKYPGPCLAAYTNLWRFLENLSRRTERTHIELHNKYGDIVRLGPNVLSFADPRALKTIYGLNKGMTKSAFYPVQQAVAKGERLQSMFSTRDEAYHARYRRAVNSAFSMSALVNYEPLVDRTTDVFITQTTDRYAGPDRSCEFSRWLQFFAFDVVGELTWSRRLGFVDRDEDVDGIVGFVSKFLSYAGPVGQMPWLDLLSEKNPVKLQFQRWGFNNTIFPVTRFALDQAADREAEMDKIRRHGMSNHDKRGPIDLLMKFTQAQHDHPEFMTSNQVLASCTSMIFAGSETTAISLSAVFYNLIKNPRVYTKLMSELDEAAASGLIKPRINNKVSWSEAQQLPYLDACIQESFRLHPAAGLILERVVPPEGITIVDTFVPGGTIVGCNAWVLHRRPEIFGKDADIFRPERWLEADPTTLRDMKATMFQFGAGARTCLGKNISLLEIYKLVPTFLLNFDIEMETPGAEWRTECAWFVRQLDFNTVFKRRAALSRGKVCRSEQRGSTGK